MTNKKNDSTPVGIAHHGEKRSSVDGAYKMKPKKPPEKYDEGVVKKEPTPKTVNHD